MMPIENRTKGFTLIELMIAMSIAGVVLAMIFLVFQTTSQTQTAEKVGVEMQQDLRAGFYVMKQDLRRAGFDGTFTWGNDTVDNDGVNGIDDVREQENDRQNDQVDNDSLNGVDDTGEYLGVTQAFSDFVEINYISAASTTREFDYIDFGFDFGVDDTDRDGVADSGAAPFRRQKPETGAGLVTFIENTHAVAFAFAFDYDNNAVDTDGLLDTSPNGNVIWAFDSDGADTDGDGILELDTILDTNDDGVINTADTPGGDDITNVGGAVAWTTTVVPLDHIRAIRVWLLVRSDSPIRGHTENTTYVVGARRVIPNDNFRRRMLSTVIKCPNLW